MISEKEGTGSRPRMVRPFVFCLAGIAKDTVHECFHFSLLPTIIIYFAVDFDWEIVGLIASI